MYKLNKKQLVNQLLKRNLIGRLYRHANTTLVKVIEKKYEQ